MRTIISNNNKSNKSRTPYCFCLKQNEMRRRRLFAATHFFYIVWLNGKKGITMMNGRMLVLVIGFILSAIGCAKEVVSLPKTLPNNKPVAFGKIQAFLTGPTNRWSAPQVRFFELENLTTKERIRVDVESADSPFFLSLPAGEYELARVQINEGAFRSMAQLNETFEWSMSR